ncbi:Bug family tripartite tricarboxylate transporter substrate binding protein [Hydrogenophaga sp.]|uniref:Bug family tripartite tricarboxylate transporter substrate binding protein n=1 Tax=Hydrogenophaga sp. TaxID=1904254 RepID=UPI0035647B47
MQILTKPTLRLAVLLSAIAICLQSHAADLTAAPLHLVVPFSAGGTADALPRILAEKIRLQFPKGVVVENRAGAGGNIGADQVAKAKPDGFTLLASPPGPIAINRSLYPRLTYDSSEWVPITVMAEVPNVLAVRASFPANTVEEFLAYVNAHPGKITFASQGNGSTSHLTAALFESLTGTQMIHVPYKGTAPALTDLLGGHVDVFFDNLSSSMPLHLSGKIRILAVTDKQRSEVLPEVPAFAETGLPAMQAVTWFAVVAPPGTPNDMVRELNRVFVDALKLPDVQANFAKRGARVVGSTPQQMDRFVREETARWAQVIKAAKITVD